MATCLVFAASPLHSRELIEKLRSVITGVLSGAGVSFSDRGVATRARELASSLEGCSSAIVVVSTGGTEHIVLGGIAGFRGPVLLVAHPYANSLPALLELYPLARRLNASPVVLSDLSMEGAGRLVEAVKGLRAATMLRRTRLGIVGRPSPWLVYSRVEPGLLREKLGVELVEIPMERLEQVYRETRVPWDLVEKVASGAVSVERSREELGKALRLYRALERIVEEERLDAFTIECFEVIPRLDTTACLALSLFNSRGIVAGCEGDVPATLSMMLLSYASGQPVFMANPAVLGDGEIVLAHCTAPIAAGTGYRLMSHFETGRGVGVSVTYPKGATVTLARLDPHLELLRLARGRVKESGTLSGLHCRTQVRIAVDWDPEVLLEKSIGNHYVMAVGDHVEALKHAARLLGLRVEVL